MKENSKKQEQSDKEKKRTEIKLTVSKGKQFLERYYRFAIIIILPLLTLILYEEILFTNLFLGFCTLAIIFAIGLSMVYWVNPPKFEKEKLNLMIFLNNLIEINIKPEEPVFKKMIFTTLVLYRRYKRRGDNKYKDVEKRLFSRFFVNIEWILSLFLLYVPSILIPIFSQQFDFKAYFLLILNIFPLWISIITTTILIVSTNKYRRPIEKEFYKYIRSLIFSKKWSEYMENRDVINSMINFLEKPKWIYPIFIKFYSVFAFIIGIISFLFQF